MSEPQDIWGSLREAHGAHLHNIGVLCEHEGVNVATLPLAIRLLILITAANIAKGRANEDDLRAVINWVAKGPNTPIAYTPLRVLLQDMTGGPVIADLQAMRDWVESQGYDPSIVDALLQVDLVIDHSVIVEQNGSGSLDANRGIEMGRNEERYRFFQEMSKRFRGIRVVPPGTGICHQVNTEFLASVVALDQGLLSPDCCYGTDSHTTMVSGLGVLGWGVGGIEAEAAMLGNPVPLDLPEVVGVKLTGELRAGAMATDIALRITDELRRYKPGMVGKIAEFFGPGVARLSAQTRSMIANMAPEYGATTGLFPIDQATIDFLQLTARDEAAARAKAFCEHQGIFGTDYDDVVYSDVIEIDISTVTISLAGPARPQDRVELSALKPTVLGEIGDVPAEDICDGERFGHGAAVIAAITSCTNTSDPMVILAAGLLAKKAVEAGLTSKPWVKTTLAPGSRVVTDYLEKAGLLPHLAELGFDVAAYGCTTCIGKSGGLLPGISEQIADRGLNVAAVLSGNRNFAGRVHADSSQNYLASPPLVVALALAGRTNIDLENEPLGNGKAGDVFLRDIWPTQEEIAAAQADCITPEMFAARYSDEALLGSDEWQALGGGDGSGAYRWPEQSTFFQQPPFLQVDPGADSVNNAAILGLFGESITTDHISPASLIVTDSPAAEWLTSHGANELGDYGSRRGAHDVMVRGTFDNKKLRNLMDGITGNGGLSVHHPSGDVMSIYEVAMRYRSEDRPMVVLGGKDYGMGSSRDWAAKGTYLLGIKAVIVESFERIHRSNLLMMGVAPILLDEGITVESLGLTGSERVDLNFGGGVGETTSVEILIDGEVRATGTLRLHSEGEVEVYKAGGVLPHVANALIQQAAA